MLLFHLTCETITTRCHVTSPNSRPQVNTCSVHPRDHTRDTNTYLASSRTYPSMSPTSDTRCWAQSVHQSHRRQSQGPPSCPTSQLRYWQPKGLPAPLITQCHTPESCIMSMEQKTKLERSNS